VTTTSHRSYTIKEAATLTGLPASTLRYYESIGVITPISRGASSGHRVYDDADLDQLMGIACMAATGMSVADMKQYVANRALGEAGAADQIALLEAQQQRLEREAEQLVLRQRYVALKIDYWRAIEAGESDRAEQIGAEAATLAGTLRNPR
jgi:DNA-binding transcriptional MerR regulator